jgi:superfamily I DNA/RNA helicase
MELTQEQVDIINSTGDIKINAVAGSGKTTTIIEYARSRPKNSKILYLAFNKSVKLDAIKKFENKGITNVKVETAHSLAYKNIVYKYGYKIRAQGYNTYEIVELMGLKADGDKHTKYILANHINKFITYFCNSNKSKVNQLNYLDTIFDPEVKSLIQKYYEYIELQTRLLLGKMNKGDIEISHDFYLKKFQLSNPHLSYDYILFDEGQDASPAMLDIFLNQNSTKVIVGDTHQQIYSWRYAVNSLNSNDFKSFGLTRSFRFSQDIADFAIKILNLKKLIVDNNEQHNIFGLANNNSKNSKATIARTNLGLLLRAIQYTNNDSSGKKELYFEGNINSYTYADEGTSLYDVLNLFNNKRKLIKDMLIKQMKNISELEDYINKTEDGQLGMMLEIVKEYQNDIPTILKNIKERHIVDNNKEKADMIFSTVHRCKGMEYDSVYLADDFISKDKIQKIIDNLGDEDFDEAKLSEEVNILYVAATRTRNLIHIPKSLLPENFPPSIHIIVLDNPKVDKNENNYKEKTYAAKPSNNQKSNIQIEKSLAKYREKNKSAFRKWTEKMDDELTVMYCEGKKLKAIAAHFDRSISAVSARIRLLDLANIYE